MKVKLCGFTEEKSVEAAVAAQCNFLGFVFYDKSVRNISVQKAVQLSKLIPKTIAKVAVVVDSDFDFLQQIAQKFSPEFFQFHGNESPEFLIETRKKFPQIKIIKAFKISEREDLDATKNFEKHADFFLFDSKISGEMGGSGKQFDWKVLQNFNSKKDWFLSGGINIDNIEEAIAKSGAKMIDVSSGIEKIRGEKSPELIAAFMQKITNYVN